VTRIVSVALLAALGCAGPTVRVEPITPPYTLEDIGAVWSHDLRIGSFQGYAPGEYCVGSEISEGTEIRYMILVRVSLLGTTYVATQEWQGGSETLEIRLRKADVADKLYADFDHTVRDHGAVKLRFSGTTMLPIGWADWDPVASGDADAATPPRP